ncbi:MAG TPA: alkaline phosphatase family protein [Steroidobacteraceae bacterium]|nr:alkaline phosphatase family protein [Steroidobacteraceae bacterium]
MIQAAVAEILRKSSRVTAEAACIAAISTLVACNSSDDSPPAPTTKTLAGVVAASGFVAGSTTGDPTLKAGYYSGATVFIDANGNGILDSTEVSGTTDANGKFSLTVASDFTLASPAQLVADIGTSATNTATAATVPSHLILRASAAQFADQTAGVVISPTSSEVQRRVEANGTDYATEKANLATYLSGPAFNLGTVTVSGADALADVNTLTGSEQYAVLYADNALTNRYTYATTKLDRHDLYPDNLAVKGGDPRLVGKSGVTAATIVTPLETQAPITFAQSQQAAFNVEGVPAFDSIFIIMEENKSTDVIVGNLRAPTINGILNTYGSLTTYYSTGNPSEPNYSAIGGGDDFGVTDDNWYGCGVVPSGPYALQDVAFAGGTASDGQPLPAFAALPPADSGHRAGYSAASATCGDAPTGGNVHNIPGDNLFTLVSRAGMTIRTYSESMNPGQDPRADSIADPAVSDKFSATSSEGITLSDTQAWPVRAQLYRVKHGPSIDFQTARNLPEFYADNRTIFGMQYTEADWKRQTAYPSFDASKWIYDQFGTDLAMGDVGNINFVVPDQCDDMHGVGTAGTDGESCALGGSSSNNGQNVGVTRADIYLSKVIDKIKASALWKNKQKRVAIVVMFDEGEGGSNGSCCGWNAGGTNSGTKPVTVDAHGVATAGTAPTNYAQGNFGHGNSIFGIITNQQDLGTAKKGIKDSDAYSHFSLVRTLQDMFQLADPAVDASYLNRAKYTEAFIAANILALPEFASSADTHFDSVRPINHAYVIPSTYHQKLYPGDIVGVQDTLTGTLEGVITPQVGPDASQDNVWAVK